MSSRSNKGGFNAERREKMAALMVSRVEDTYRKCGGAVPLSHERKAWVSSEIKTLLLNGKMKDAELDRLTKVLFEQDRSGGSYQSAPRQQQPPHQQDLPRAPSNQGHHPSKVPSRENTLQNNLGASVTPSLNDTNHRGSPSRVHAVNRRTGEEDVWAEITLHDVERYKKEERSRANQVVQSKAAMKAALDRQVAERKAAADKQKQKDEAYIADEKRQLEQWKQAEAKVDEQRHTRIAAERRARDDQLKAANDRKAQEESRRKQEDAALFDKIQSEIRGEREKELAKKQKVKDDVQKFLEYNTVMKGVKEQVLEQQAEEDRRLQREYIARLEKEEKGRQDALRKMYERQARSQKMGESQSASLHEKALADQLRAEREQQAQYRRQEQKEQERVRKQERYKAEMKLELERQVSEHQRQKDLELEQRKADRERTLREAQEASHSEYTEKVKRKQKNFQHRKLLEEQMKSRQVGADGSRPPLITPSEIKINQKILQKLDEDI